MKTDNSVLKSRWMAIAKQLVRVSILAVVGWCIWRTVVHAQDEMSGQFSLADLRFRWIVLAGLLYLAGLFPCWVFWHRTLWAMGQRPRWRDTLPAFWIGHLGKYVPGKAMVVVLRTGLVSGERVSKTVAATSVFVETLTMMAVGAFLAAAILLLASSHWSLMLLAFGLMVLSGAPTIPPVFRRIVRALQVHRANPEIEPAVRGLDYRLMATGWLSIGGGWFLLGLSLWATLRAMPTVDPASLASIHTVPLLTAAVGLAVVAGFLSLIPGGLGVRDTILMTLLAPTWGPTAAIISAVLLRLVWLVTELAASAVSYVAWRYAGPRA